MLAGVDQHQLAIVLGVIVDLVLAGDGDSVARAGLDPVHPDPAARHEVEVPIGSASTDQFAGLDRRAEDPGVGVDGQRAVIPIAAGEQLERALARILGNGLAPQLGGADGLSVSIQIWNKVVASSSRLYSAWVTPVPALIT